jgi:hypothetical protein
MKRILVLMCIGLAAPRLFGQETNEVEQLKQQLQQLKESSEKVQQEQRQQIDALTKQLNEMEKPAATGAVSRPAENSPPWSPTEPIRIGTGGAYMDIGLVGTFAVGGSTADDIEGGTQLGGHDPHQRGFSIQGVEVNFAGAIDPYFRGTANILFAVDSGGESFTELEEAWLETVSLPGNFQMRAGQILTDFGRVNTQHPHSWAFADVPLVNGRFLGADGLRNPGVRVGWLAPTPFFTELSLGIQNSQGETAASFRSSGHSHGGEEEELPFGYRHQDNDRGVDGLGDMLFSPRLATSFDLTESQTLLLGTSAAFGPNSSGASGDTTTQIYGVDLYWKWKPANAHGGFPFVSWQTEAMLRRYDLGAFDWAEVAAEGETPLIDNTTTLPAVLPGETVTDYGFYSQVLYGFRKGWVAGFRVDFVRGDTGDYERLDLSFDGNPVGADPERNERWRLAPDLTWYPSEFSKIRLQYNYDDRRGLGSDHSVWLQFEFLLGAHAAHKF